VKSRIPRIISIPIIALGLFFVLSFSCLVVGNKNSGDNIDQIIDVDRVARAFAAYPESHGGHFPSFRDAEEVTKILNPLLSKEAAKKSDYNDLPYTTLSRLETVSKGAVWNMSVSGTAVSGKTWIFYLPAVHSPDRFIVGYTDGTHTNGVKSQLPEIFGNPTKN
jgi:hypothetical protein